MKLQGIHHILGTIFYLIGLTEYGISLIKEAPAIELFNRITIPVNITYFFILLIPILFVFIATVLFGNIWVAILLLVPHPVLFTYNHNIRIKDALDRLIRLPTYKGDDPRRIIDKLIKWRVWPVIIAYLEWLRFNEPDARKKYNIARLIGDFGGNNALIRAMGEDNKLARLGVTDALEKQVEKQGNRALKKVIKSAYSENPIVRLSAATVLSNPRIRKNNPEVESVLAKLKEHP